MDYEYLESFKLEVNWKKNKNIRWIKLATFSLLSDSSVRFAPYCLSFFPMTRHVFAVAYAKELWRAYFKKPHVVEIDIIELLNEKKGRKGRNHAFNSQVCRKERNQAFNKSSVSLLVSCPL
ncbi:hypothetical protein RND81_10G202700 [Saponaria officinalis]|uniref:Uncharacterized protein n=1 Tax=Saponaria officinalis TaxID=3572 RepID=A0AAW1I6X4_SAPOF